jgi:hypothetical protein
LEEVGNGVDVEMIIEDTHDENREKLHVLTSASEG